MISHSVLMLSMTLLVFLCKSLRNCTPSQGFSAPLREERKPAGMCCFSQLLSLCECPCKQNPDSEQSHPLTHRLPSLAWLQPVRWGKKLLPKQLMHVHTSVSSGRKQEEEESQKEKVNQDVFPRLATQLGKLMREIKESFKGKTRGTGRTCR